MTIRRATGLIGGQFTGESVRPQGYQFPVGLSGGEANTVVDYLVVAGGGGAAAEIRCGAGGAGGFRVSSGFPVTESTPYTITVGSGGPGTSNPLAKGSKGSNSIFSTIHSEGGGGGGAAGQPTVAEMTGTPGGSGGGGGGLAGPSPGGLGASGNTSPVVQGSSGGNGGSGAPSPGGGGGGGASAPGGNSSGPGSSGAGGNGSTNSFLTTGLATSLSVGQVSGPAVYYAGGGGSGHEPAVRANGGLGGGGHSPNPSDDGMANSGGGGGPAAGPGGNGGKGVVIIRYLGSQAATGGANVTSSGGYTVHTFTGDGTFATNAGFGGTTFSIN